MPTKTQIETERRRRTRLIRAVNKRAAVLVSQIFPEYVRGDDQGHDNALELISDALYSEARRTENRARQQMKADRR